MTQYESKLLHYLQLENSKSGKCDFALAEVLTNIGDFGSIDMLKRAFDGLETNGYVEKTQYIGVYHLC